MASGPVSMLVRSNEQQGEKIEKRQNFRIGIPGFGGKFIYER